MDVSSLESRLSAGRRKRTTIECLCPHRTTDLLSLVIFQQACDAWSYSRGRPDVLDASHVGLLTPF